jgi:hypothetical protein
MKAALVLMCVMLVFGAQGCSPKGQPTGSSQPKTRMADDSTGQPAGSPQWNVIIADDFKDGISASLFNLEGKYVKPPVGGGSLTPRLIISCSGKELGGANIKLGMAIPYGQGPAGDASKPPPRIRVGMQWDDKKAPDEDWAEVINDGRSVYLDKNQTLKLLTGHPVAPDGPHGFVHRQSISLVDALGNRIVMQFDLPVDSAGMESDCGLETGKKSHKTHPDYNLWGDYHSKRGEYDDAIASYEEGLKLDPSNTELRQKLVETIKTCKTENAVMGESLRCGAH